MGNTIVEKTFKKNTKKSSITPGEIVTVNVDRVMIHDLFAPFVIKKFNEMGFKKIWDSDKVVFIYDHLVPTSFIEDSYHAKIADDFAILHGIKNVHRADGVCHQLMPELKYALPGNVVFGTDSHTTTYGAVGATSTGIGYTEMAAILGTGTLWVKVPSTHKVVVNGTLPKGVYAKDLILTLIGDIKADGANYKALEFAGNTIEDMSVSSRMTLCNMAVEAGAKFGIIAPDEKTAKFCDLNYEDISYLKSDSDALYEKVYEYNASDLKPVIACPSNVDNIKLVKEMEGYEVNQVFLGSCTNGRLEDLKVAAEILKNKKVAKFIKFIVTPASRNIYAEAVKLGYISTLIEAGAIVNHPSCGLCCGRSGGIVSDHERVVATNNRNFLGRMGSVSAEIFLASPATAAATALTGKITNPTEYLN